MTTMDDTPLDTPKVPRTLSVDGLSERLLEQMIGSMELAAVWLGIELGLYARLRDGGPATSGELAGRAGIDARYAREWLEQQAVAGLLEVTDDADGEARAYTLPAATAEVLLDPDNPAHMSATALWARSLATVLPRVPDAYRTGAGIPYADYGDACRDAIALFNRPMFHGDLAGWLASAPDVRARLGRPGARVLDAACGTGWSSIALARAFPGLRVDGIDLDEASIADARRNAAEAGRPARVGFQAVDASALSAGPGRDGGYDAAFMFEALHDLAHPVPALAALRGALADGASLIVADEKVAETFTAPGDDVERMDYGFSFWHCLPASRAEDDSAATGTCLRPATVRGWAEEAGYATVEVLGVDNDLWRFYRLT
jgi:SAM-dependent methyltransferase